METNHRNQTQIIDEHQNINKDNGLSQQIKVENQKERDDRSINDRDLIFSCESPIAKSN